MLLDTLYKLDSNGKLRVWYMELDGDRYRTYSGLVDGKHAVSGWTTVTPASKKTPEEQARFEVEAQYKHQLDREYRRTTEELASVKHEFIEPMLAKTYKGWSSDIAYFQPKLDGIRCIMTVKGMFSRQGQPIVAVPHLHAELAPLFKQHPSLVLDGELYNHDLRDDFGAISSIVRKKNPTADEFAQAEKVMQYHVYDTVHAMPFGERSLWLDSLLSPHRGNIVVVPTIPLTGEDHADMEYANAIGEGYEGGIYRVDASYELGKRSKNLLKRKDFVTEEFPVVAIEEGNGNWAGAAKRFVLKNNNGTDTTFGAGVRGSYDQQRQMLHDYALDDLSTATATVRYFMRSPDGIPRFPVVIDFHPQGRKD